jgi:F-type H+-transporting ATPase subunit epsilon
MCELGVGQVRYRKAGQTRRIFIDGGFAQVLNDKVTILTDSAAAAEEITPAQISAAQQAVASATGNSADALQKRQRAQRRVHVMQSLAQR